jgi:hypothetical protein
MALAPPLLIYLLAYAGLLLSNSPQARALMIRAAVWAVGIAALLTSGWRAERIFWVGWGYTVISAILLPFIRLFASCSVGGPCL